MSPRVGAGALPTQIGRYQVLGELGRGAMGRVVAALDPRIDRKVAIKIFSPAPALEEEEFEEIEKRFLSEARAAGRLLHPSIVTVYDAGTDDALGAPYIVMELVEGETLKTILARCGQLEIAEAVDWTRQAALALAVAHAHGVYHRDVKPGNLLITPNGILKISDFGIAKIADESMTLTGQVLGTPNYMSPEQVLNQPVDGRSDLFSLGVVLYRCVSGEVPFASDSIASISFKIASVDPRPVDERNPAVPRRLAEIIHRALAKRPEDRFQTGAEFAAALAAVDVDAAPSSGGFLPVAVARASPLSALLERTAAWRRLAAERSGLVGHQLIARGTMARARLAPVLAAARSRLAQGDSRLGVVAVVFLAGIFLAAVLSGPLRGRLPQRTGAERSSTPSRPPAPSALPSPMTAATPPASPGQETSYLQVYFENRLAAGRISVRVDGKGVWSRRLAAPKNVFKKVAGQKVGGRVPVPPGKRSIAVIITGTSMKVDVRRTITGTFRSGATRRLDVELNPYTDSLDLELR